MSNSVKVAFASCSEELIPALVGRLEALYPQLDLYVVSEFPPPRGHWIPYHARRRLRENFALCRAALKGKRIRLAGVVLQPRKPYRRMRLMPILLAPFSTLFYNENLDHFTLRPRSAPAIIRHLSWRIKEYIRWQVHPGGDLYTFLWRLLHPGAFRRPLSALLARVSGALLAVCKALMPGCEDAARPKPLPKGISVVIPSRNGRNLLARLLPGLLADVAEFDAEVIVVDNGSDDSTREFLCEQFPSVLMETSPQPLSFARAVNRGIRRARFSHVCLLNNDMVIEPGFFRALSEPFERVPDLFCATAQILFPPGVRRQETGKAVMPVLDRAGDPTSFPIRCELPVAGEDCSYVLYGSGGCSLYDTVKLRLLGFLDEIYEPAYVEDLDAGYRAWQRGWPTVFTAAAKVEHRHRATTSRYFPAEHLERMLEVNYLKFLARRVASASEFHRLWSQAVRRLNLLAVSADSSGGAPMEALAAAWRAPQWAARPPRHSTCETLFLALGSGDVAVFPAKPPRGRPVVQVVSPYLPFPLSHGGAVRIYNLMRRGATDYDQVLLAFVDELATPPAELLDICCEIVEVRRRGSHAWPSTDRPTVVEEFDSPALRAALVQMVRKWQPALVQLEFTQMGQYAPECRPAKTVLVEHDITFDLFQQLLDLGEDWEIRRQLKRWIPFERAAWRGVDCVVAMSEKDRLAVSDARAECLPNGVDLDRFRPRASQPEAGRLLFVGSFAHLPNVLAAEFFLRDVWPRLERCSPALHIIAGARHRYFLDRYRDRVRVDLQQPRVEVEDFVADVRPAYARAEVIVAPLVASAGTNIKIMEAMAMGKAIVSTPAGINGLAVTPGRDLLVAKTAGEMAEAIVALLKDPARRQNIERQARATAERQYDWDVIAGRQKRLYESLGAL